MKYNRLHCTTSRSNMIFNRKTCSCSFITFYNLIIATFVD
ncbi:MAG TPA: hypothetical protein ENK88_01965 [Campylobacterales bacterium]|nr:hypothetical protein [Campylobacterales bacterium]